MCLGRRLGGTQGCSCDGSPPLPGQACSSGAPAKGFAAHSAMAQEPWSVYIGSGLTSSYHNQPRLDLKPARRSIRS